MRPVFVALAAAGTKLHKSRHLCFHAVMILASTPVHVYVQPSSPSPSLPVPASFLVHLCRVVQIFCQEPHSQSLPSPALLQLLPFEPPTCQGYSRSTTSPHTTKDARKTSIEAGEKNDSRTQRSIKRHDEEAASRRKKTVRSKLAHRDGDDDINGTINGRPNSAPRGHQE